MTFHTLNREQKLPISRKTAWAFFSTPSNLNEITPPEIGFRILGEPEEFIYEGQIIRYRIQVLPMVRLTWVTEIKTVKDGVHFVDTQQKGPYKFWHHLHTFDDIPGGVLMRDIVHYGLGFGVFGTLAHAVFVRRKLDKIFDYRRELLEKKFGHM